ncbi:MAG: methylenetetrahydrofolate reductase [Vicingaceae bacterium]|nr:MAG: methylenetetrahydrofolate reductase [Bacteroidia bacterium]GIV41825.1 MAG: methylenetetrahydrofolate reductase [Vicingaceae bacterium]
MHVTEVLKNARKTLFSFEILPPLKGKSIQSLYESIDPLLEFKPAFINVTYHREEYVYKKREKGYLEKIAIRKRPGTVGICAAIQYKYNIITVPHLICGGFTREETENALIDLHFLGIDNVLALRGDPIKTETVFHPEPGGNAYAIDLVKQINAMNKGKYLDEDISNPEPTNFCIGVAGYPEKHFEAPNMELDLWHLKNKVDAGAQYIVTQLFFDNKVFFDFVDKCRQIGISVPIIPGIKPITKMQHLQFMPKFFHVNLPQELVREVLKCKNDKEVKQVGIEWGIHQSKELIEKGVPCIHYYTMGRSESVKEIAKSVF